MTQAGNAALDTAAKRPTFCGTTVTAEEWSVLTEIIATCGLSRHELARTICEGLGWVRRNGNLKTRECYEYLEVVEAKGLVTLPPRHEQRRRGPTSIHYTKAGRERPRREGKLSDVAPVMLGLVANAEERALWRTAGSMVPSIDGSSFSRPEPPLPRAQLPDSKRPPEHGTPPLRGKAHGEPFPGGILSPAGRASGRRAPTR